MSAGRHGILGTVTYIRLPFPFVAGRPAAAAAAFIASLMRMRKLSARLSKPFSIIGFAGQHRTRLSILQVCFPWLEKFLVLEPMI